MRLLPPTMESHSEGALNFGGGAAPQPSICRDNMRSPRPVALGLACDDHAGLGARSTVMTNGTESKFPWPAWSGCIWFLLICFGGSGLISFFTADGIDTWYRTLNAPSFAPPDLAFPLVWSALYVLITVAGWRLWRRRRLARGRLALAGWVVQLALNFAWPILFFGLHMIGASLADIILMAAAIVATIFLALGVDRPSAWLLLPYFAWVGFAGVLNAAFLRMN